MLPVVQQLAASGAIELKNKKIAIISSDNAYSKTIYNGLKKSFSGAGWEIVVDEVIPSGEINDWRAFLAKVRQDPPDLVVNTDWVPANASTFITQFLEDPTDSLVLHPVRTLGARVPRPHQGQGHGSHLQPARRARPHHSPHPGGDGEVRGALGLGARPLRRHSLRDDAALSGDRAEGRRSDRPSGHGTGYFADGQAGFRRAGWRSIRRRTSHARATTTSRSPSIRSGTGSGRCSTRTSGRTASSGVRPGCSRRFRSSPGRHAAEAGRRLHSSCSPSVVDSILVVDGVSKSFGSLRAVDDVSLSVEQGEIFGIAGPNGSGKSTLFNIITSIPFPADSGRVVFEGKEIQRMRASRICRSGLARTFQKETAFDTLSTLDNVILGSTYGRGTDGQRGEPPAGERDARVRRNRRGPVREARGRAFRLRQEAPDDRVRHRHGNRACCCSTSPRRA